MTDRLHVETWQRTQTLILRSLQDERVVLAAARLWVPSVNDGDIPIKGESRLALRLIIIDWLQAYIFLQDLYTEFPALEFTFLHLPDANS